jgi:hypothetical protein
MADIKIAVDLGDVKKFPDKARRIDAMLQHAFDEVIEKVYRESQQLVPVATGALRDSGRVTKKPIGASGFPETAVEYGNENVTYAVYVHENLEVEHKAPTQAKYLEVPLLKNRDHLKTIVAARLKTLLESP